AKAPARHANARRIEGVALGDAKLAPDDFIPRPLVTGDLDALDEDLGSLPNVVGYVDDGFLAVAAYLRPDVDERIAERAGRIGHGINRVLDQIGVVPVAL